MSMLGGKAAWNSTKKQLFSMSDLGAKPKVRDYLSTVSGSDDVAENIVKAEIETLSKANISGAKLSGDRHLMALEMEIANSDPYLADKLLRNQEQTNILIRQEMQKLGGTVKVEETQAYLQGRVNKLKFLAEERLKMAGQRAKDATESLSAADEIANINQVVRSQIDQAKATFKNAEEALWNKISPTIKTATNSTTKTYQAILAEQGLYKSSDKDDIPQYIKTLLGQTNKKGDFIAGDYKAQEGVLDLKQLRTRISGTIEASDSPNQQRLLSSLRDAITKDMDAVPDSGVKEAIAATKLRHDTFEGDVMNKIFARDKFGKVLDEDLTLQSINATAPKGGLKAAVSINKILEASPQSYDQMENLVKVQIANSTMLKNVDGYPRININTAKKYMESHKKVLDIFPKLKDQLDYAIGQEQRFMGTKGNIETRIKNIEASTANKLAKTGKLPGQVLGDIKRAAYPKKEMAKVLSQSNKTGRRGIRNDIIDELITKSSSSGRVDDQGFAFIKGSKLLQHWTENKAVYAQAFNKYELMRFEKILNTAIKNQGLRGDVPPIGDVLPPTNLLTGALIRFAGLSIGHKAGQITKAPLHTTSRVMRFADSFADWLDGGKARKLLRDAIEKPELFKLLTLNPQNLTTKHMETLSSWMMGATLDSLNDDEFKQKEPPQMQQPMQQPDQQPAQVLGR